MEVCTYCDRNTVSHAPDCPYGPYEITVEMDHTDSAKYHVSADIIGHLQPMSDLPEIGVKVQCVGSGIDIPGEVFAHVPHPTSTGWGFALIRIV